MVKTEASLGVSLPLHARNMTVSAQDNTDGFVLFLKYVSTGDKKAWVKRITQSFCLAAVSWQCNIRMGREERDLWKAGG